MTGSAIIARDGDLSLDDLGRVWIDVPGRERPEYDGHIERGIHDARVLSDEECDRWVRLARAWAERPRPFDGGPESIERILHDTA